MLEGVLVHPEPGDVLEAAVVLDERVAVIDHGLMRRRPADTELAGKLGDRVQLLTDTTADLPTSAFCQ